MGKDTNSSGGGCGCVGLVVFILVFWAIFFGLPINEKKWNIDIFPPRIWDMNAPQYQPLIPAPITSLAPDK